MYRDYLSECMRMLTKTNATAAGEGSYMVVKCREILHPPEEDNRTTEEIIAKIRAKLEGGAK